MPSQKQQKLTGFQRAREIHFQETLLAASTQPRIPKLRRTDCAEPFCMRQNLRREARAAVAPDADKAAPLCRTPPAFRAPAQTPPGLFCIALSALNCLA
jgi:hypothetical protein